MLEKEYHIPTLAGGNPHHLECCLVCPPFPNLNDDNDLIRYLIDQVSFQSKVNNGHASNKQVKKLATKELHRCAIVQRAQGQNAIK